MRRGAATLALVALGLVAGSPGPATLEYVVKSGESLWSIAGQEEVYADPLLWPVIYRFNRDQIQDPALIYPKQRLQIPKVVDGETRRAPREPAGALRP